MERRTVIHSHIDAASEELLAYIRERMPLHREGWVPAAELRGQLDLNFVAVPKAGKQYGKKGWMFAILARALEDRGVVEYKKIGSRAFYRAK